MLEVTTARAAEDAVQRPDLRPPPLRVRLARRSTPCKAIRTRVGTTVNDVVVAICAGAVREWLLERDALPEDPLVAMIPMSVRTRDERGAFGNRISMMIVPIPTDEPDPRAPPAAHPRAAAQRQGAPQRAAGDRC